MPCGFDLDGDGRSQLNAWNGIAGLARFTIRLVIQVPVGELVRIRAMAERGAVWRISVLRVVPRSPHPA